MTTAKHYLREGLLPDADVKKGRNSALYAPSLADRIQRIKALQREQFLPLRLIKSVLEGRPSEHDDDEAAKAIERALESMAPHEARTRTQLRGVFLVGVRRNERAEVWPTSREQRFVLGVQGKHPRRLS